MKIERSTAVFIYKMDRGCKNCPDCRITRAKMYSGSDISRVSDRRPPEKRRSFLQQPKSYISRLPAPSTTYSQPLQSTIVEADTPKTQPIPIPQTSPGQNTVPDPVEPQEFFIGDRITIGDVKTGTLLYFGTFHLAAGLWCGIALDEPDGTHDGLVGDVRYFTCRKGHGIFAPVERVAHLDHKAIQAIVKSPPKVSQLPSKSKLCYVSPIRDEIGFQNRSNELSEVCDDIDDNVLGLDENGIIQDDEEIPRQRPRRKLPKLPHNSYSRIQYVRGDIVRSQSFEENLMDESLESQQTVSSDGDDTDGTSSNIDEKIDVHELQNSAGGSSGGEDSWSLNKDYIAMCDGKAQYLNITFDGESESKTSTQEPSEESPSPEFIFDQEMIEDGEFTTQPIEMSRDSSLGLISSFALDKNDLLNEFFGNEDEEDVENATSQGTLEPMSEDKDITPEKQDDLNMSVEFDESELAVSTPHSENKPVLRSCVDLNATYTQDDIEFSQIPENEDFNSTYTQDDLKRRNKILNSTFTKENEHNRFSQSGMQQELNHTFTLNDKNEQIKELVEKSALSIKGELSDKGAMTDSGISMRGSMTESAMSARNSMVESNASLKGSIIDPSIRRSMLDSGIAAYSVMQDSNSVPKTEIGQKAENSEYDRLEGSDDRFNRSSVESDVTVKDESVGLEKEIIHKDMDDRKLMSDLTDGHHRKERPISFLSTTSADTGYAPDTDSEIGTLTLNSPQEWMDRGFHGNIPEQHTEKNLIEYYQGDLQKMGPVPIESDSDFGTMTGDTDNEADRIELLRSEGVIMDNIQETEESEDEVTQVEDTKVLNTTVTLEGKQNDILTGEPGDEEKQTGLNSTFEIPESNSENKSDIKNETGESVPIVTITIEDKESDKKNEQDKNDKKMTEKQKTPKKKKFNVVKDFKKPNTTNVVSKLSEYLKTPVPVKPREDKTNTEEFKNKRNSLKGKIDLSKVTSKIANKSVIEEPKKVNGEVEKKDTESIVEKEPVKKIKRTPPKSKWDAIMSKIDSKKDEEKTKPKPEVKSKVEAFLHIPPPAPPKREEAPKPKKRLSSAIPDYSKVQSKLKYTAPPPKPKADESPNRTNTVSPNRRKSDAPNKLGNDSPRNKINTSKSSSPSSKIHKDISPSRDKENIDKNRRSSTNLLKNDRVRNLSGDSFKRPAIKDKIAHIDLADSLDGRGSITGTGSVLSSRQSSRTDVSTTDEDAPILKQLPQIERAMSLQDRRDSSSAFSETSEAGSQVTAQEMEQKLQKAAANQQRRKSGLNQPSNSLDSSSSGEGGGRRGGRPKIVKPVLRQQSEPSPLTISSSTKRSLFTNKASTEKAVTRRSRYQNRNKTGKSKKESKEKNKPPETVLAEVHTKEVHRLEALCESRTKQLNMVKLQLQSSNLAFDGMSCIVNYLANDLDGFSAPGLLKETESLKEDVNNEKTQIKALEEQKASLEGIVAQLKEQHKDYVNSLEIENEKSLKYQRESLISEQEEMINVLKEKKATEISEIRNAHEAYIARLEHEHSVAMKKLQEQHTQSIQDLQRKQENQMEEHHRQHQDKLEQITSRFDSIKLSLSDKVETLRSECDRLRDRAKSCEEALQRDSDFKVQCALAPFKNLPQEIESLKTVLEMKNDEINKLRSHNIELQKKLEELPVAQEKIIGLNQKKENLEAIISMKTDHEKVLHERCQNLMRKYDKESRANKRLSMEYEELMWKLSESFSETDMGSQEALFYQKLGMSPTGSGDTMGPLESPGLGRKLRTPPGSDSSPSRSPGYRRTLSSSLDDRDEKKLRRRSGNYLLDEKKQRPTSPLAKQNPLTQSWSPSTQVESPIRIKKGRSGNQMSQSWCVDMDTSDDQVDTASKIPRSHSSSDKAIRKRTKAEGRENTDNSDSGKAFVSLDDSNSSQGLNESVFTESLKTNGSVEGEDLPSSSSPISKKETTKLQTNVFTDEKTNKPVVELIPSNVNDAVTIQVPSNKSESNTSGPSVSLSTGTVSCPVSKLPTKVEEKAGKDSKLPTLKGHTETTV